MMFLLFWVVVQGISCPAFDEHVMIVMPAAKTLFDAGIFFLPSFPDPA